MEYGTFEYKTKIKKINNEYKIISFNSPYDKNAEKLAINDIKFVIEEQKMIDIKSLSDGLYNFNFQAKFIEEKDKYNIIFVFEGLKICHKK